MSEMAAMEKEFGTVGVLYGGESAEREISLRSGNAVISALQQAGIKVKPIDIQFNTGLLEQLAGIDHAFIALHGRGGEDGIIQAVLETLNIPYTGSAVTASAIAMDKLKTKLIWSGAGIPTPSFKAVGSDDDSAELLAELGGTVMVKPLREGSSIGMSKATDVAGLNAALSMARKHDDQVLVEQWITGQEFTCALLDGVPLPVIRLKTPHEFYDFDAKYSSNDTDYLVPCGLTAELEQQLQALCLQAFNVVGCKGWGRVDAMLDQNNQFWLLEINTVPGLTEHSLVPMAAKASGLSFAELIIAVLRAK